MENGAESKFWLTAKILWVWSFVGITSWSEAASFAACCLTCWIFFGHIWREAVRPLLVHFGYAKPLTPAQQKIEAIEDSNDAGAV
jgi:FtsH-binding integral membrane protein